MCMRNTSEGCVLSEQQSALKKEVLSLDERMDKLEKDFATMRSEMQDSSTAGRVFYNGVKSSFTRDFTAPTDLKEKRRMTKEMQELIDRDLNAALESGDAKLVDRALINSQRALADCQLKTAERVKAIAADHPVLVGDVREIKVLVQKAKRKAWEVGLSALKWIIVGGGGVEFIRYLATGHP